MRVVKYKKPQLKPYTTKNLIEILHKLSSLEKGGTHLDPVSLAFVSVFFYYDAFSSSIRNNTSAIDDYLAFYNLCNYSYQPTDTFEKVFTSNVALEVVDTCDFDKRNRKCLALSLKCNSDKIEGTRTTIRYPLFHIYKLNVNERGGYKNENGYPPVSKEELRHEHLNTDYKNHAIEFDSLISGTGLVTFSDNSSATNSTYDELVAEYVDLFKDDIHLKRERNVRACLISLQSTAYVI